MRSSATTTSELTDRFCVLASGPQLHDPRTRRWAYRDPDSGGSTGPRTYHWQITSQRKIGRLPDKRAIKSHPNVQYQAIRPAPTPVAAQSANYNRREWFHLIFLVIANTLELAFPFILSDTNIIAGWSGFFVGVSVFILIHPGMRWASWS